MNEQPTRVLVIEDNQPNRTLIIYLLQAFGYSTVDAEDGEKGLEAAQKERPALIICDVQLPKLDGYGVVKKLKADPSFADVPVIAVTALAMVGDRDRILAGGFDGYVSKPISPETFVHDVEAFLPEQSRTGVRHAVRPAAAAIDRREQKHRATILVVDDVAANIDVVRSTLEPLGYRVFTASAVQPAVEVAEEVKPDLILCGLHMHPENGSALLDRATTNPWLKRIPIAIISSTAGGDIDRKDCFRRGAAAFITRPIEPSDLLAEMNRLLASAKTRR